MKNWKFGKEILGSFSLALWTMKISKK